MFIDHVQHPKCLPFKSTRSVTSNLKHISLSPFHTILVALLLNMFFFTQSAKAILVCNTFSIIALFLLVYIRFYMENVEG